jgi:ATP-binding cassette subfamily B protein
MQKQSKKTGSAFDWQILKRIFTYTRSYKKIFFGAVLTTIFLAAIAPVRPYVIKYMFDHYVSNPDVRMLMLASVLLVVLLVIEAVVQFADSLLTGALGQNIIKDLRLQIYKHVLNLRLKYYDATPIGTIVTRTVSDIEVVADIFAEGIIVIIGDVLKLMVILAVMFYMDVKLTFISLATIPILLIATYFFKKAVAASFNEVRNQVARLNAFVQEHITGMNIVQIFNSEKEETKKFKEINAKHRDANIKAIMAYSIFFPVVEILSSVSLALLIWWGSSGVSEKPVSLGEIASFTLYINMMFRPIRQLADKFNTLQMGVVASERVFKVIDTNEVIENKGKMSAETIKGVIDFKNVWFAYSADNWVLKNVSFKAELGHTIAIVGATGAGKSSIINLLNRFYEYNKGEVLIDGYNVRDYELSSLRKNIGVVLQDVFLFSDTIYNNITLNNPEITEEQVIAAAKVVGAYDFISKLPGEFNYNVMERGGMLSVGQRQLISFVRAYVYNPKILVLDEATSSIDTESEKVIQHATNKLTEGRTSIIIAHRLATIQQADKIIVMDKGEIIEEGTHQELLKQNGAYKKLFELQFKNENVSV